jgi:hypothetical protein
MGACGRPFFLFYNLCKTNPKNYKKCKEFAVFGVN